MSFGDHLEDLRRRVFFGILGVVPIFVLAFAFGRPLLGLLIEPARRRALPSASRMAAPRTLIQCTPPLASSMRYSNAKSSSSSARRQP